MTKDSEKENITPTDTTGAAENKVEGNEGKQPQEPKSPDMDDKIEEKKKQLEQLREAADEETEKLRKLREERRQLGSQPSQPIEQEISNDDYVDEDTKKSALSIFYRYHPEYKAENDPGNIKYNDLNKHYMRLKSGTTIQEQVDTLEYVHETFLKPKEMPKIEEVTHDIGETSSVSVQNNQPSAMSRKLNQWEQKAANHYPGGESEYRKHLADLE